MVLHSNKEGEQKETEKRLARLMNTGRYECGVRVNGYGFERRKRIGFRSSEKESYKKEAGAEVKVR